MATIVLAHGIFGFGDPTGGVLPVHYFNGVGAHLRDRYTVIEPSVDPTGYVADRGNALAEIILGHPDAQPPIHIIAHSMGGLDARYALAHSRELADLVVTLVTIGTPHRGSPVADALYDGSGPLRDAISEFPEPFRSQLALNTGALHDLTTDACKAFNASTQDLPHVQYIEVAGDASKGGHELYLFQFAKRIGGLTGVNDGVVTKSSALRDGHGHTQLADWPVDHAGEIGWTAISVPFDLGLPLLPTPPHLARYDDIVALIEEQGDPSVALSLPSA